MLHRRPTAAFLACIVCIPLSGCVSSDFLSTQDSSVTDSTQSELRFDTANLKKQVEEYKKQWEQASAETDIQAQIDTVVNAVDEAYAKHCRAQIAYYADWNSEELDTLNHECTEDYYVADDIASWFFANGYQYSPEPSLFEPYIEPDQVQYFTINNLTRVIAYAKSDATAESERIEEYYKLAYDETADIDITNKRCAKIYLDSLKSMDVSESLYDYYHRDYAADDVSAMFQSVKEQFVPLRNCIEQYLSESDEAVWTKELDADPYDLLKEYAAKLSPAVAESADKLFSESLYTKAEGVNCYDGSYTINLPNEQIALMYTYLSGYITDLMTVTHEFGHFHADWRDTTPICLQQMNLDLAEAQSQCMVSLFLPYYQEVFGSDAEQMQLFILLDLLDSLISGFAVGAFEYQVMQQLDTISPSETADLFAGIMDECRVDLELYEVTHLFEQPGYYISYGISALPAIEMYTIVQNNPSQAMNVYDRLSSYSCLSGEYGFRDAMQRCGFTDYFLPGSVEQLADDLTGVITKSMQTM